MENLYKSEKYRQGEWGLDAVAGLLGVVYVKGFAWVGKPRKWVVFDFLGDSIFTNQNKKEIKKSTTKQPHQPEAFEPKQAKQKKWKTSSPFSLKCMQSILCLV